MRHYTIKPKKQRTLHVINQSGYQYQPVPTIILRGKWLEEFGFKTGKEICVKCSQGKLIIENIVS